MKKQLLLAILPLVLSVVSTSAQGGLEQAAKNARDQFSDIKNRSIELERMKREANKRPASDNSAPGFPEVKEDFEQIQKINSDFLQPTVIKTLNANILLLFSRKNQNCVAYLALALFV
jgi:hypothetical protein